MPISFLKKTFPPYFLYLRLEHSSQIFIMYKARTVVNNLVPFLPSVVGRDRFASWLSSSSRNFATSRACFRSTEVSADPFLNGSSSSYVEEMYNAWLENPKSVHKVSKFGRICRSVAVAAMT